MLRLTFYVPKCNRWGNPRPEVLESVVRACCIQYGGATVTDGEGSWVPETSRVVRESVSIVEVLAEDETERALPWASFVAGEIKAQLRQKTVLFTVETLSGYFV